MTAINSATLGIQQGFRTLERAAKAAAPTDKNDGNNRILDSVILQIQAREEVSVNISLLKTQQAMTKSLLDILL
ncbi:MAG: hypothetical protein COB53_07070 [Elusimicrobia bacterium]|nr:MAG: hypothetical protein COB53_07070 [Elusimicrobiota bacterium]